jgi:hypothetical protein
MGKPLVIGSDMHVLVKLLLELSYINSNPVEAKEATQIHFIHEEV